ncbi:MAG TPA: hypothetical protein VKB14_13905 [Actinomycetales bacterium]|nr:hypothetical protein [Actinomycetales bacterium]
MTGGTRNTHAGRVFQAPSLRTITLAVVVLAFLIRLVTFGGVGLRSVQGYDDGVYYAGAVALLSGRLPYRDFLFLHPPGILLVAAPFAEFGRLTSDSFGLLAIRVAFCALGALNAGLVTRVAARNGLVPATVAGLCYALWYPAIYAERTVLLEASGNTALLVALLLLGRTMRPVSGRAQLAAGAAMGLAACVKIWMLAPLAVLLVWQLMSSGRRSAVRVAAGAAIAGAVVLAPFLTLWDALLRMVVLDQMGRPRDGTTVVERLREIGGLQPLSGNLPMAAVDLALLSVCLLTVGIALLAWSRPEARVHVLLLAVSVGVLLSVPTMFDHYAAFAAVPFALVLADATAALSQPGAFSQSAAFSQPWRESAKGRVPAPRRRRWVTRAAAPALLVLVALLAVHVRTVAAPHGVAFPATRLRPYVAARPCLVTDVPIVPVLLDVLSRDLDRGCPLVVDVMGEEHHGDRPRGPDGVPVVRQRNALWQGLMQRYLTAGSTTVLARPETGLSATTTQRLTRLPLLVREGQFTVLGRPSAR